MNRKAYRMIVLVTCLLALMFSMLACDGGDGCTTNSDGVQVCTSWDDMVDDDTSFVDTARETVNNWNSDISQDTSAWVSQHSAGTMDCLSVWDQSCEDKGAYDK
jgi:hypothetical protein